VIPSNTTVSFSITARDASLDHHPTTSPTLQFNIAPDPPSGYTPLLGMDPTLLGLGGLGLGLIALIVALTRRRA
jgi:hypothetical protein